MIITTVFGNNNVLIASLIMKVVAENYKYLSCFLVIFEKTTSNGGSCLRVFISGLHFSTEQLFQYIEFSIDSSNSSWKLQLELTLAGQTDLLCIHHVFLL